MFLQSVALNLVRNRPCYSRLGLQSTLKLCNWKTKPDVLKTIRFSLSTTGQRFVRNFSWALFSVAPAVPQTLGDSASEGRDPKLEEVTYNVGPENIFDATFYQYSVCPFCSKARTFLALHQIPLKSINFVEVNPFTKKEIKFSDYKKVPFVVLEDASNGSVQQINGSDDIIDYFVSQERISESEESRKWRNWVNDDLAPLLPMNLYRTVSDGVDAFDYITSQSKFTSFEKFYTKYLGAVFMNFIARRSMKKRQVENPKQQLVNCLATWTNEGLACLSSEGNVAEAAVFGVVTVLDGNYKIWVELKAEEFENSDRFWQWYDTMKMRLTSA